MVAVMVTVIEFAKWAVRGAGFAVLVLLWTVSGCSGSGSISAKNYPHNCANPADCAAVLEGVITCCHSACPNTAIRKDALDAFMIASEAARKTSCNGVQPPCPAGPICEAVAVTCDNGVCGLAAPQGDAAAQD